MKLGLSRFACLRRVGEALVAEGPRGSVALDSDGAALVTALANAGDLADAAADAGLAPGGADALAQSLVDAGVLVDEVELAAEATAFWDFDDLRFHTTTRPPPDRDWMRQWPPPPELPPKHGHETVALPRPDIDALERDDLPFARVQSLRASIREPGPDALTIEQLGEFLFRVGRVEDLVEFGPEWTIAPRPYPAAGALYELELYVAVNACDGVERGLYHYRADEHALAKVAHPTPDVELLLEDATAGMGAPQLPSVLVVLAARFPRISWKYGPLAYALLLKNVGVVIQTMYLVATAMGLAPCAVGTGNEHTFARATGLTRDEATSVGEFCLSSGPSRG